MHRIFASTSLKRRVCFAADLPGTVESFRLPLMCGMKMLREWHVYITQNGEKEIYAAIKYGRPLRVKLYCIL